MKSWIRRRKLHSSNGVGASLSVYPSSLFTFPDNEPSSRLQEGDDFLLTPFERNIEVWRQLWRVVERSHLVVQIVDARNPLRFRCKDLEDYVKDVEGSEGEAGSGPGKRRNMLLINKADLLTAEQRYAHILRL
jgi:ribosome biogenesis GTPase A